MNATVAVAIIGLIEGLGADSGAQGREVDGVPQEDGWAQDDDLYNVAFRYSIFLSHR